MPAQLIPAGVDKRRFSTENEPGAWMMFIALLARHTGELQAMSEVPTLREQLAQSRVDTLETTRARGPFGILGLSQVGSSFFPFVCNGDRVSAQQGALAVQAEAGPECKCRAKGQMFSKTRSSSVCVCTQPRWR